MPLTSPATLNFPSSIPRKSVSYSTSDEGQQQQSQSQYGSQRERQLSADRYLRRHGINSGLKIYVEDQQQEEAEKQSSAVGHGDEEVEMPRLNHNNLHHQRNISLNGTPSTSNTLIDQRPFFDNLPNFSPVSPPLQAATQDQSSESRTNRSQGYWTR